jgi:cell division protein FtsW (lipid II flippase)
MLVPVELLTKGMQYIPFLFFQLAVTVYLAGLFVHVDEIEDENQFLALSIFLGYFLASAIFEPDFGSWVRHESATFPVLHLLVMSSNQRVSAWKTNAEVLKSKFHKQAKHSSSWEGEVA